MRVKMFWQNSPGGPGAFKPSWGNAQKLEDSINDWLAQHPRIKIVDVRQSASGGSANPSLWLYSVWYEGAE